MKEHHKTVETDLKSLAAKLCAGSIPAPGTSK
jgi:hypothetical protein